MKLKSSSELNEFANQLEGIHDTLLELDHDDKAGIFGRPEFFESFKRSIADIIEDIRIYHNELQETEDE